MGARVGDLPGAWGWVSHLRDGGTTPWADYRTEDSRPVAAEPFGERLPGAQQLELLRRINAATGGRTVIADGVLRATLTGRGQPEFALAGIAEIRPQIDPAELAAGELLRVAASAIADALILGGLPTPPEPPPVRRRRRHFHLLGDPWLTIPLREQLVLAGHPSGGMRARTYVVGDRFDQLVVDAWSAACFDNGPAPWEAWLAKWTERDRVPGRVDLVAIAERHRRRSRSVEIVLDPSLVGGLLGVRRPLSVPRRLAVSALEISRRVAVVLGGLVSAEERTTLLRSRLLPLVAETTGPRLALPGQVGDWAQAQAGGMRTALADGGYRVHGGWDALTASPEPAAATGELFADAPTEAGALKAAVTLLGREVW